MGRMMHPARQNRPAATLALVLLLSGCAASRSAPRTAAPPDDQTLKMRVQTSMMNASGVHPNEVTTAMVDGVATLTGTVHDQAEVDAAIAAARRVEGVRDVRSDLKIR